MSIKILLADDHHIVREGFRFLIEQHEGMTVVADAENGREAIELAWKHKPDVVIMDINMPDLNGIDATRQIHNNIPEIKIIGLSVHSDTRFIKDMLIAGVSAYLLKECTSDELFEAIHSVIAGRIYLSPKISGSIIMEYLKYLEANHDNDTLALSPREREVLQLIAEGKKMKEIAEILFISLKTVETHRQKIMNKLNMFNVADLTKYAIREGLTCI